MINKGDIVRCKHRQKKSMIGVVQAMNRKTKMAQVEFPNISILDDDILSYTFYIPPNKLVKLSDEKAMLWKLEHS